MKYDQYGQVHTDVNELCELLYANPSVDIAQFVVDDPTQYNDSVKSLYGEMSLLEQYHAIDSSIEDFDKNKQQDWFMPASYQELDIASWLLDKCKTQEELQRVGIELILFQERNLFPLLCYLKYLVDTMRENRIVWGVGRGSSTASYCLYLLGVHKIDSLYFQLDITEFLK